MKTMKWLIKREMWENKGMLLWTPVVISSAVATLGLVAAFIGKHGDWEVNGRNIGSVTVEGTARANIADTMAQAYMASSIPLLMVLSFLVFFYCLGALHDERRDRSLLFWKSLPVSDLTTVLSKVLMAVVVAPLITLGIAVVMSLVILAAGCMALMAHGTNMFGALLLSPDLYLTPLRMVALLPVYALWALPTVGWLLMVSSWARSKVFLWAVGTPVISALLMLWAEKGLHLGFDTAWYTANIVDRILLGVVPGSWLMFDRVHIMLEHEEHKLAIPQTIFNESWGTLAGVNVWVGAAAGVAMIATAVWMRRRREEA